MIVARSTEELGLALGARASGKVAFVPTMGALHQGHLRLVETACGEAGTVIASIFVNPTQFAPGEDYDRYPRSEEADAALLAQGGCDILFAPSPEVIYPDGFLTTVSVASDLTGVLCGAGRGPGHFAGVCTVVARLFALVSPDISYFGEKDWQQLAVVRAMASDLFPSVEVRSVPTVRDLDGVALSSRNAYLSTAERQRAASIPMTLAELSRLAAVGEHDPSELQEHGRELAREGGLELEYLEIRDERTLSAQSMIDSQSRAFIAARLGGTRLIDNLSLLNPAGLDDFKHSDDNRAEMPAATRQQATTHI